MLAQATPVAEEPAKRRLKQPLSQHLLALVNVGYIVAHESKYVHHLCRQLREGLLPRQSRVVLVCPTQMAVAVKLMFRQTMAQFESKPHELPFHAMMYSSSIPGWHTHRSMMERGTEHEAGLMTNERLDFEAFHQTTSPDMLILTESKRSLGRMLRLSARYFGTGGRNCQGILWPGNTEGTLASLKDIPSKVAAALESPSCIVTI